CAVRDGWCSTSARHGAGRAIRRRPDGRPATARAARCRRTVAPARSDTLAGMDVVRSPEAFPGDGGGAVTIGVFDGVHRGHQGLGTLDVLHEAGQAFGFAAEGVPLLEVDGRVVSSSSIRAAVAEGDLAWPRAALGRRFAVDGQVVRGAGRGLGLGYPTANLE